MVTLKKTGTTKISYVHAGKKHTVKYIVKKYVNPIKSLTVGGKNYASCFAASKLKGSATGAFQAATNASAFTGKLKVTPKAGWKVTGIYRSTSSGMAKVKNGSTVKKETFLQIELKNKKTGQVESFMFSAMGKYYKDFITMSTSAVSEHEPVATKEPAAVLRAA